MDPFDGTRWMHSAGWDIYTVVVADVTGCLCCIVACIVLTWRCATRTTSASRSGISSRSSYTTCATRRFTSPPPRNAPWGIFTSRTDASTCSSPAYDRAQYIRRKTGKYCKRVCWQSGTNGNGEKLSWQIFFFSWPLYKVWTYIIGQYVQIVCTVSNFYKFHIVDEWVPYPALAYTWHRTK